MESKVKHTIISDKDIFKEVCEFFIMKMGETLSFEDFDSDVVYLVDDKIIQIPIKYSRHSAALTLEIDEETIWNIRFPSIIFIDEGKVEVRYKEEIVVAYNEFTLFDSFLNSLKAATITIKGLLR